MRTPLLCTVSHTPRCPNSCSARRRGGRSRHSSGRSKAVSTTKRISPACCASQRPMACSMASRTCGVKRRRVLQRVVARWRMRRGNFMSTSLLPASGGAATSESSATTAESTAAESSAPEAAAESAEAPGTRVARPAAATRQTAEQRDQERARRGEQRQEQRVAGDPHQQARADRGEGRAQRASKDPARSEEHTSELQSPCNLVCRLLLEKKKRQRRPACSPLSDEAVSTT